MNKFTYQTLKISLPIILLSICLGGRSTLSQTLPLTSNLISFNTPAGERLLLSSRSRSDFFPLSTQFVTQENQAFCGVASMVMVLNSLQVSAPEAPEYKPFKVFTQGNFFNNPKTIKVVSRDIVARQGMTLQQLGNLLASYDVKVEVYHAGNSSLERFRQLAQENLKSSDNFILVNYLRKEIGQESGGHISPLAAYNESTDRFLIMDVSRYKYPPVWVKTSDLWKAMNTQDQSSGKTRGFVLVSK
ncbi:phytochelatin synthase family protein [Anabaena sp. FACHB-1237]|uniref:phytochelatin synthase family protein n=1 Tax=Anabaena sp. FACHB-1237 TaxID=2692769 RepID=UPI001680EB92|nr:phytochelatin synthase family protein [Anabaena sp. FACHB-1237]MBD2136491.1 phytochelatin synthase family protein [Anabaena sp. FACHB-1237]